MAWNCCGQRCPRKEIEFLCQTALLFLVVAVSLYNLTTGGQECRETLWASLLSASVGLCTPGPVINKLPALQEPERQSQDDEPDSKRSDAA